MAITHSIVGGGGTRLYVVEGGNPAGPPIVFIHGWSQCQLCWRRQFEDPQLADFRLLAFDLRGHGESEKPAAVEAYSGSRLWADDVAAVIRDLGLERPVLVGWSYGGLVIGMYARHYGDTALAGIDLAGAAARVSPAEIGTLIGGIFADILPAVTGTDLAANIAGMRRFMQACFAARLSREVYETALCWNMVVPAAVRGYLLAQPIDVLDALAKLTVPTLVSHGRADQIVLPATAELILAHCPGARASWYPEIGHAPFLEAPERFNRELAGLARGART